MVQGLSLTFDGGKITALVGASGSGKSTAMRLLLNLLKPDSVTESFIVDNMVSFFRGKTVVVIAHRLQRVKDANKTVVLEEGEIVQEGSFDPLVSTDGGFPQL